MASSGKRRRKPGGSARMREQGYHQVQVWFDAQEWARVRDAGNAKGMPAATYVRWAAVLAANGILEQKREGIGRADLL